MGFGGGSFGGGGGGGGGISFHSSSSYSSSSYSGGGGGSANCPQVLTIFAVAVCFFTVVYVASEYGFTEPAYCTNGESLNPYEQMWCRPTEKTTVTSHTGGIVTVHRFDVGLLAGLNMTYHHDHVEEEVQLYSNDFKYYSFVMNPGSSVTAVLESNQQDIECLLLDYDNMVKYTEEESYTAIRSKKKKLVVESYSPEKSDNYFFVFGNKGYTSARIFFDLNFTYKVYDVEGLIPACSDSSCTFENVGPNEIIIADNRDHTEHTAALYLPDKPLVWSIVACSVAGGIAVMIILSLVAVPVIRKIRHKTALAILRFSSADDSLSEDLLYEDKPSQPTTDCGTAGGTAGTTEGYGGVMEQSTPSAPPLGTEPPAYSVEYNATSPYENSSIVA